MRRALVVAVVGALGLVGCASTEPIAIDLRYRPWPGLEPAAPAVPCRIAIARVDDQRSNREHVGLVGNAPVHAERVPEWVVQSLEHLVKQGRVVRIGDEATPRREDVVADVAVRRLYARTAVTQFEAVVVLSARFTAANGVVAERDYRGSAHKVNWFGGGGEVVLVLNEALSQAVARIGEDLPDLCRLR